MEPEKGRDHVNPDSMHGLHANPTIVISYSGILPEYSIRNSIRFCQIFGSILKNVVESHLDTINLISGPTPRCPAISSAPMALPRPKQ